MARPRPESGTTTGRAPTSRMSSSTRMTRDGVEIVIYFDSEESSSPPPPLPSSSLDGIRTGVPSDPPPSYTTNPSPRHFQTGTGTGLVALDDMVSPLTPFRRFASRFSRRTVPRVWPVAGRTRTRIGAGMYGDVASRNRGEGAPSPFEMSPLVEGGQTLLATAVAPCLPPPNVLRLGTVREVEEDLEDGGCGGKAAPEQLVTYLASGPAVSPAGEKKGPVWLRRWVLWTFSGIWWLLGAVVAAMAVAGGVDGVLGARGAGIRMLTGVLPPIVLIALAMSYERVSAQASVCTRWIHTAKSSPPSSDHEVKKRAPPLWPEYSNQLSPVAAFHAAKRGHYLVALTAAVSTLLGVQVVLSAGLFRTVVTPRSFDTTVRMLDLVGDLDGASGPFPRDATAHWASEAVSFRNYSPPFGCAPPLIHQTFAPVDFPASLDGNDNDNDNNNLEIEVRATVDGVVMSLECEDATDVRLEQDITTSQNVIAMTYSSCPAPLRYPITTTGGFSTFNWIYDMIGNQTRACSPANGTLFAIGYTALVREQSQAGFAIRNSTSMLCAFSATTASVDVALRPATNQSTAILSPTQPSEPRKLSLDVGALTAAAYGFRTDDTLVWTESDAPAPAPVSIGYLQAPSTALSASASNPYHKLLGNPRLMREALDTFYTRVVPVMAHFQLRDDAAAARREEGGSVPAKGSVVVRGLGFDFAVACVMAVLFAIMGVCLGVCAVFLVPEGLLMTTQQLETAEEPASERRSSRALDWRVRASATLVLLALIGACIGLVVVSGARGDAPLSLPAGPWPMIPTLLAGLVCLYFITCRHPLASYITSYTNRPLPAALLDALKTRTWPVILSELCVVLAAAAAVLSSVVWRVEAGLGGSAIQLRPTTVFIESINPPEPDTLAANVFHGGEGALLTAKSVGMTDRAGLFNDLAFPTLSIPSDTTATIPDNATITARIPAVRASPNCTLLDIPTSDIQFTHLEATASEPAGYWALVPGICPGAASTTTKIKLLDCSQGACGPHGVVFARAHAGAAIDCSGVGAVFAWGLFDADTETFGPVALATCSAVWTQVDADVVLRGPGLVPEQAVVAGGTSTPTLDDAVGALPADMFPAYADMFPYKATIENIDPAFHALLLAPWGALRTDDFLDERAAAGIMTALGEGYASACVHEASAAYRASASGESASYTAWMGVVGPGRGRVVQRMGVMYALIGVFGTLVVLNGFLAVDAFLRQGGRRCGGMGMEGVGVSCDEVLAGRGVDDPDRRVVSWLRG